MINLNQNVKKDYKFLIHCLDLGGYIGLTPYSLNFTGKKRAKYKKISQIIIHLLLAINCYFALKVKWEVITADFNPMFRILTNSISAVDAIFIFWSTLYLGLLCRNDWNTLLLKMQHMEYFIAFSKNVVSHWLLARVIFIYSLLFLFHVTLQYGLYFHQLYDHMYAYFYGFIANFYMTSILVNHMVFLDWLEKRYNYLNEELYKHKRKPNRLREKIVEITKNLKLAGVVVQDHNKIYGSFNFLQVLAYSALILLEISFSLYRHTSRTVYRVLDCLLPIFHFVSLVLFTEACDTVETCGLKIIRTCYSMHHQTTQDDARLNKEELLILARYAQKWRPVFSLWNFFHLNRSSLPKFLSAIVTYTVIVIQFDIMASSKNPKTN